MSQLRDWLFDPWPWYVSGPLIGLFVPALLLVGNKLFGMSSTLRHACAAALPRGPEFFRYDWRAAGSWSLVFALGVAIGGAIGGRLIGGGPVDIGPDTRADLALLGVRDFGGLVPADVFSWRALLSLKGLAVMVGGGVLVGFGTAYAGGCTSGHGITGMASFERASLVATVSFFAGGLVGAWLLVPLLLGSAP
jgi:uncharacterized membrane protein YedE/YeeE